MSGLVGSITYASMTYNNDIDNNNVIKGIKMANYLDTKILELELAEKNKPKEDKKEQNNTTNLVEEIKEDMTR